MKKILSFLILIIWTYTVIVLPTLFFISIIHIIMPGLIFFDDLAQKVPDFQTLILLTLFLPGVGTYLGIKAKKINPVIVWKLPQSQLIITLAASFLLSYIFWRFFSIFSFLSYFGLLILLAFFLLYIPQLSLFLNSINFYNFKEYFILDPNSKKGQINSLKKIALAISLILLINLFVVFIDKQIRIFNRWQLFLLAHPEIKKVEPTIVYYANKVVLLGQGFGWKGEINTDFYNQFEAINIDLWTDRKVIFTVPLHWKLGNITIWVEKPVDWAGKKIKLRSNKIKLRLISRDNGWDADDDAYFEQLKSLEKETLRLNGYK